MRTSSALLSAAMVLAGCSGTAGGSPAASSAPTPASSAVTATSTPVATVGSSAAPAATPAATATPAPTATRGVAIVVPNGLATINPDALAPIVFVPPAAGSADPFYHVHTTPALDGFFLSIEAYTKYGPKWTGQLGTFAVECTPTGTGICVHFDPDGPGPQADLGKDFKATGQVTFTALSATGFDITLTALRFSDGTTVAGPLRLRSS